MHQLKEFKVLILLMFLPDIWGSISTEIEMLSNLRNSSKGNWHSGTIMSPLTNYEPKIVSASDFYLKEILKQLTAINKKLDRAMIRLIGATVKGDDNNEDRGKLKFSIFTEPNCESLKNSDRPSGAYHFSNESPVMKKWFWNIFEIYCDQSDGGGWTVIQRRGESLSSSTPSRVNFSSNCWDDYAKGFGDLNGEFWLGNEWIHRVGSYKDNYRIKIDGEKVGNYTDFSNFENSSNLTIQGSKEDLPDPDKSCTGNFNGTWWNQNNCITVNLNSDYYKNTKMMIRLKNNRNTNVGGEQKRINKKK